MKLNNFLYSLPLSFTNYSGVEANQYDIFYINISYRMHATIFVLINTIILPIILKNTKA